MQLQLRPSAQRFHPLLRPQYRRAGFAGLGADPGVNPTTIWTPSGGWVGGGGPPAVFVPPTVIAAPSCVDSMGNALADPACVNNILLPTEAANLAANTAANYNVDRANCENAWAENNARYQAMGLPQPPDDCAQRTFGLTLPGTTGSTVVDLPNAQALLNPTYSGPSFAPGTTGPGSGGGAPAGGTTPKLTFTNLTTGDNSTFKVGDRWQINITGGPANHPVTVRGGQNGANTTSQMGVSDSAGNFLLNGQMDQGQVGNWSESWSVGPVSVASFTFTVSPATAGSATSKTTAPASTVTLPGGSIQIGGTSIPLLAIGAGVVVLFLLMRK